MVAAQAFLTTTGGNIYPDPATEYDQSEAFRRVALNRDGLDSELKDSFNFLEKTALLKRGLIPEGANVDTFIGNAYSGAWYVVGLSQNVLGLPDNGPGNLTVITGAESGFSHTTHLWSKGGSSPSLWWRSLKTSGVMNPWTRLDTALGVDPVEYRGFVPEGQNLDDLYGYTFRGQYYVPSSAHAATFTGTLPPVIGNGTFQIISGEQNYNHTMHVWSVHGSAPSLWVRMSRGSKVWSDWVDLLAGGGGGDGSFKLDQGHYGTPNMQLISDFEARHPQVSTGNKGVISIRFDHGLTKLMSDIFAMLDARGWKCIVAMNSRNWDKAENAGMTPAQLAARIANGSTEVGNHTADGKTEGTHKDMDTKEQLWDGIVVGKRELEQQLGHPIEHFIVPGTVNGMGGFAQGANMDVYSSTYAGSLILAHHAIASGGLGEVYRVLDGRTKQCQRHWNIEAQTVAAVKSRIDTAAATKTGLQLMMHPRYLDEPGFITKAMLTEIFEYIDAKVAAGELVVLGASELIRAKL